MRRVTGTPPSEGATHPIAFLPFCEQIGLALEPYERKIERAVSGPQRETVVLIPRGNGKTSLLAAISLHHLVSVPGAAVYAAAASREQARILYEAAAGYARVLEHPNLVDRHLELRWCEDPRKAREFTRHMRVLAAEARLLHGLKPSLVVIDEMHAHPDDEVYIALRTAMLKIPGSKLIVISSAGQGADSPLGRLRARALAQPVVTRKGAFTDALGPGLRLLEWSLDEDADVTDPDVVKLCNPASWITPEALEETRLAVPELSYRRFHCGQWTERAGHWLPAGAWQACTGAPVFTPGEDVWVGVDVGGDRSASAVCWINEEHQVGVAIYHGDQGVLDCAERIRELAVEYRVREVVYDPWRAGQMAVELEQQRINVSPFAQTDANMLPASDRLYRAIVERRLVLPDDAEMRLHAANTIAKHSRRGWRLDRPNARVPNDSIIALAMALDACEQQPAAVEMLGWI